jgi:hypothetical protein
MSAAERMSASDTTPEATSEPRGKSPRRTGRPSTVDRLAAVVMEWLRAEPMLTTAQARQRARSMGYRGGKSAFYDLIRRVRFQGGVDHRAA